MRLSKYLFLSVLFVLGLTLSAQASTLGNGGPDGNGAADLNSFLEADNFTTTAGSYAITGIQFWAVQASASDYTGTISWSINSDNGGAPGAVVYSGDAAATGTATGNTPFGLNEYLYSFDLDAILAPGGTYWLELHNGPDNADPSLSGSTFYWETSNGNVGDSQSSLLTSPPAWSSNEDELAFQANAVPEPTTLSLIGAGLLAGAWKRRNRSTKN
jgi:hypothetical protein